jgi:phytoene/squalene synthetase
MCKDVSPHHNHGNFIVNHDQYLLTQMDKVSRSFAVVVASVEQPLRAYLSIAYLLCRVVDNIEDCHHSTTWKKQRYLDYEQMLNAPTQATSILIAWEAEAWHGLTENEKRLMGTTDGLPLWRSYAGLPSSSRSIIGYWTLAMAQGMSKLGESDESTNFMDIQGVQVLEREVDYNQYCYIVAGTVGHMATELVIDYYQLDQTIAGKLQDTSEACGRALQKTNIIKDYTRDLERGVCYLPAEWLKVIDYKPLSWLGAPTAWKQMALQNVLNELHTATEYVLSLPYHLEGYRMASLLCLLPAYQTNLLAAKLHERLFTSQHSYKISRLTLTQCMLDARRMQSNNDRVIDYRLDVQTTFEQLIQNAQGQP